MTIWGLMLFVISFIFAFFVILAARVHLSACSFVHARIHDIYVVVIKFKYVKYIPFYFFYASNQKRGKKMQWIPPPSSLNDIWLLINFKKYTHMYFSVYNRKNLCEPYNSGWVLSKNIRSINVLDTMMRIWNTKQDQQQQRMVSFLLFRLHLKFWRA